jgi:hypothetical protein
MVALIYSCLAAIGILVVLGLLSWNISRRKYDLEGFLLQTSATLAGETIIEQPYASDSDSYEEIELDLQVPGGHVKARQRNKGKAERVQLIDVDVSYTGPNTQTYLKRAASVILGAPRRVVLLSALVGTGVHLLTVTLVVACSADAQQCLANHHRYHDANDRMGSWVCFDPRFAVVSIQARFVLWNYYDGYFAVVVDFPVFLCEFDRIGVTRFGYSGRFVFLLPFHGCRLFCFDDGWHVVGQQVQGSYATRIPHYAVPTRESICVSVDYAVCFDDCCFIGCYWNWRCLCDDEDCAVFLG